MNKYLTRICKAILADRFNNENYRSKKTWNGRYIQTMPLFCSYGTIGFTATIFDYNEQIEVEYDWEMEKLTIDGRPWKDEINLRYLEDNDINCESEDPVWDEFPRSVELECYTDAGEDMIIDLEIPDKEHLQEYIDNFDINYNVQIWWPNGKPGRGVPFSNMKEHYEDYEDYLKWLKKVCNKMPF